MTDPLARPACVPGGTGFRLRETGDILPHRDSVKRASGRAFLSRPYAWQRIERRMEYTNSQMKLDQLIGYFNEKKINLIPPFQRGHVWKLPARQRLIKNIVNGRPIPAIFLYREAEGSKYIYNILDGKQRLETLLLFIGSSRTDVKINGARDYFYSHSVRKTVDFSIEHGNKKMTFKQLPPEVVRDFREYAIPTIEISLDQESSLDEIINLFVDINQQGVRVNRFEIIRAIGRENPLLQSVLNLIAIKQKRREDIFYKQKKTVFTTVMRRLQIVRSMEQSSLMVDRMWERLFEIVLFGRTNRHRLPSQVLKSFIGGKVVEEEGGRISPRELKKLRTVFSFLADCYARSDLGQSRLATDQVHFYTMITSLLTSDLLLPQGRVVPDKNALREKLRTFAKIIRRGQGPKKLLEPVRQYRRASSRQTTTTAQRQMRQERFIEIINAL
jgi:uncharacterized protein DUF262